MPTTERYALNDLQQAVLDTLAEELEHDRPCVEREALAELIQAIPGHDDVTGVGLGPCLAALKRRGLVAHPVGDKRCRQVYITATGMEYAAAAANEEGGGDEEELDDPGSYCASCNAPEYAPHKEWCLNLPTAMVGRANDPMTRIDPETRRVVLPESDREAAEPQDNEAAPAPGHDFKRCRHCDVTFRRPDESPIPDDRCERCHEEIEARSSSSAEWMPTAACGHCGNTLTQEERHYYGASCEACESKIRHDDHAGDPPPPAVTTLQIAIHPPGTSHLHERTILLGIDDEGAGPYLTLVGACGPIEIDDLTTLDAIRREGARLLRQAHAEETA